MLKQIIEFIRDIFRSQSMYDSLDAYITAHNPQNAGDVDRLEKEFYQRRSISAFEKYY